MGSIFSFGSRKADTNGSFIGWEIRYDGVLSVALIDDVPFAGISGPWPDGNYALTWWSSRDADAQPTLEFYPSMDDARQRVEDVAGQVARAA
ncbi:hypothetical protein [Dokdonella immobilis]|uniref:Uncharacterized protein n=1 Tax=Dokdonella immobilis TaxID=578942 RepID=A0A1I4ZNG2_9GAMM|nr:hypothetical protein [Dokdonella immobilis]SFN51728.1 hypothetical protein SAMN05216289_12736 [Dokdonella immobilis]